MDCYGVQQKMLFFCVTLALLRNQRKSDCTTETTKQHYYVFFLYIISKIRTILQWLHSLLMSKVELQSAEAHCGKSAITALALVLSSYSAQMTGW